MMVGRPALLWAPAIPQTLVLTRLGQPEWPPSERESEGRLHLYEGWSGIWTFTIYDNSHAAERRLSQPCEANEKGGNGHPQSG